MFATDSQYPGGRGGRGECVQRKRPESSPGTRSLWCICHIPRVTVRPPYSLCLPPPSLPELNLEEVTNGDWGCRRGVRNAPGRRHREAPPPPGFQKQSELGAGEACLCMNWGVNFVKLGRAGHCHLGNHAAGHAKGPEKANGLCKSGDKVQTMCVPGTVGKKTHKSGFTMVPRAYRSQWNAGDSLKKEGESKAY